MATFRHISTKLVLVLDAETAGGKKRKRVTVSNIREGVSADALRELAAVLEKVLAHPVAQVLLYTEEALEREEEEEDGNVPKTGGIRKEAAAGEDAARTGGRREAGKAALTGGGDSQRKRQVRGGSIAAFAPRGGNALSGEDAGVGVYRKQATRRGKHTRLPPPLPETEAANGRPPPPVY